MTWRALGAICSSFHVGTDLGSPSLGLKLNEQKMWSFQVSESKILWLGRQSLSGIKSEGETK